MKNYKSERTENKTYFVKNNVTILHFKNIKNEGENIKDYN